MICLVPGCAFQVGADACKSGAYAFTELSGITIAGVIYSPVLTLSDIAGAQIDDKAPKRTGVKVHAPPGGKSAGSFW